MNRESTSATKGWKSRLWPMAARVAASGLCACIAVSAQADSYFEDAVPVNVTTQCFNAQTRTVTVSETIPVQDLDVGVIAQNPTRQDLIIELRSPNSGPVVRLMNGIVNAPPRADYNVLFDQGATDVVDTGSHTTGDDLAAAPYENLVRPSGNGSGGNNSLAAFNGINPAGDWVFLFCDRDTSNPGGSIDQLELRFSYPNSPDLEMSATTLGFPQVGQTFTVRLNIENQGGVTATGVAHDLVLGSGLTVQSVTGASCNGANTNCTIGSVPAGGSRIVDVTVSVGASGPYTFRSEITAQNPSDVDSTPNNGALGEDDIVDLTFTPGQGAPGSPPQLQCALGRSPNVLDWELSGPYSWQSPAGNPDLGPRTFSGAGNVPDVTIEFTGSTGGFANSGTQQTPVTDTAVTGGINPPPEGLALATDYTSTQTPPEVTITMSFGNPIGGVGGVQIPIFDVDENTWTDRIEATGTITTGTGGTQTRVPVYTASSANTVETIAGVQGVTGTAQSGNSTGAANMWINFSESIDTLTIRYANIATLADPAFQIISIGNMLFCDEETPDLQATKTVEMKTADTLSIPGETIVYRIRTTSGPDANVPAENVDIRDTLPDDLQFVSATTTGFTAGNFANPALPASNTNCDGGACIISFENGVLPAGGVGEVIIEAVIR